MRGWKTICATFGIPYFTTYAVGKTILTALKIPSSCSTASCRIAQLSVRRPTVTATIYTLGVSYRHPLQFPHGSQMASTKKAGALKLAPPHVLDNLPFPSSHSLP